MSAEDMQMPFQRWFWRDWLADQAILMLTAEQRCVWFEMLGLMASSDTPGVLDTFGVEPEVYISFQRRIPAKMVRDALAQIERLGLFSKDEQGRIYSRRIIREAAEFLKQSANGSKGGRPRVQTENPDQKPTSETTISRSISISREEDKSIDMDSSETEVSDQLPANIKSSCPHKQILDLYHQICPMLPAVKIWNAQRAKVLKARWDNNPEFQNIEFWQAFFAIVASSEFLTGQVQSPDRPPFKASFDWLLKPANFSKVIEGNYSSTKPGSTGLRF